MKPLRFFGKVLCDESEYDRLSLRETEIQRTVPTYYGISDTGIGFIVYMSRGYDSKIIIPPTYRFYRFDYKKELLVKKL